MNLTKVIVHTFNQNKNSKNIFISNKKKIKKC